MKAIDLNQLRRTILDNQHDLELLELEIHKLYFDNDEQDENEDDDEDYYVSF